MRGFGAIEKSVEKAKERNADFSSGALNMFSWKDGETRHLRFLDDLPYVVPFHNWILCKDGKKRTFVCPAGLDGEEFEKKECPICETVKVNVKGKEMPALPSDRTVGWAADRIVEGRAGRVTAEDVMTEYGEDKIKAPWVGLVVQGNRNFWEHLMAAYARYGTIVDRDYEIKRSGERLDTKFSAFPWDQVDDLKTQEEIDERYKIAKEQVTSPADYIKIFSSVEYIEKNIVGGLAKDDDRADSETPSQSESSDDEGATDFPSLSDRLKSYSNS